LSFLAKVSGLYFLVAAVLFLVFDEQNMQNEVRFRDREAQTPHIRSCSAGISESRCRSAALLHSEATVTEVYHFALPGIALSFCCWFASGGVPRFPIPVRLWQIGGRLLPLLLELLSP